MKKLHVSDVLINIILGLVSLFTIIPFYLVVIASVTKEQEITKYGYTVFPKGLTLDAYKYIFSGSSNVLTAYNVTIIVTLVGTFFGVILTTMLAYSITRKEMRYSKQLSLFVYLPFLFNGGLVPFYMLLLKLGFKDQIYGLIIPMLINSFNVFLMVSFMKNLPQEIFESAKVDGASEYTIFFKIALHLSTPALATLTLFIMLGYWNDWYLSLLLIDDKSKYPLQFLLRQIISNVEFAKANPKFASIVGMTPKESSKMATVVITIGPILLAYPYLQRYFVKGITVGSVKG